MSDPGSIVGAVSLALQVIQGLHKYYTQFRSFHDDIDAVLTRAERIESILQVLERPVQKLWRDDDGISEEVRRCIMACDEARVRLKIHQKKCGEPDNRPDTLIVKIVLVKRRAVYPFRKDTLEDLQKQLDRMLENLQTILQVLGLDTSIRFHDQQDAKATTILTEVSHIGRRQKYGIELLEVVDRRSEQQLAAYSRHESKTTRSLQNQTDNLKSYFGERVQGLEQKIQELLDQRRILPAPTDLRDACDNYVDIYQGFENYRTPSSYQGPNVQTNKDVCVLSTITCTCTKASKRRRKQPTTRWISAFCFEEYEHPPPCPFSIPSQRSKIFGLRLHLCRGALGYLIEVGFRSSNSSMSTYFAPRNIVSKNRPAFALLDALYSRYISTRSRDLDKLTSTTVMNDISITTNALLKLIKEGRANPLDIRFNSGETIAHLLLKILGTVFTRVKDPDSFGVLPMLQAVVSFLRKIGCDIEEMDKYGSTPTRLFLDTLSVIPLLQHMHIFRICAFEDLEFATHFRYDFNRSRWSDKLIWDSKAVQSEYAQIILSYNCMDSPLLRAVTQRSEPKLRQALQASKKDILDEDDYNVIIFRAAGWPSGLKILLQHGATKFDLAWSSAIDIGNLSSVKILIQEGKLVTLDKWYRATTAGNIEMMKTIASTLFKQYTQRSLEWPGVQCAEPSVSEINYDLIYHGSDESEFGASEFSVEAAQILYEAGFTGVDVCSPIMGSPLWYHAGRRYVNGSHWIESCQKNLRLLSWFVAHGAKVNAVHPVWNTMPLHFIAERLALMCLFGHSYKYWEIVPEEFCALQGILSYPGAVQSSPLSDLDDGTGLTASSTINFLHMIFGSKETDDCNCLCSYSGCTVVSSALKVARRAHGASFSLYQPVFYTLKRVIHTISKFMPSDLLEHVWFQSSVIRALTFDAMQLAHTCHNHGHAYYGEVNPKIPLKEEEILDIQFTEEKDITVYKDLLHQFDDAWTTYDGTLLDFIDNHWTPRMEETLIEMRDGSDVKEMKRLGVTIYTCKPPPRQTSPYEHGTSEWFQWRVGIILDGTYTNYNEYGFLIQN